MRTKSQLPRNFRRLFGLLELLSVLGAVLLCVAITAFPQILRHAGMSLGPVGLIPGPGPLAVQLTDSPGETINIQNLQGVLSVFRVGENKGLLALIRWHALPPVIAGLGFCAVLFDLVRRLFRNVERGQSFTERNVFLVHKLGTAVMAFTLFSAAATSWCNYALLTYLERNATVQGIKMVFTPAPGFSGFAFSAGHFGIHLDVWGILTGLLILSLGEVFRQGLALEKENELTI